MFGDDMNKLYMGIDVGSGYTKGVIIDKYDNIMSSYCVETFGDPIEATRMVILKMKEDIDLNIYKIVSVGVTGFAKKLVGTFLDSQVVRNEVSAVSRAVYKMYPNAKTIFDIGSEDAKIISVDDGNILDYVINTSCNAGCGSFILNLSRKMDINNISKLKKVNNIEVNNRCMIYAESELINKISVGYSKEDIWYTACKMVSQNYLSGVCRGKKIREPIVFVGGLSKNLVIVKCLEDELEKRIIVNKNGYLFASLGVAMLARGSNKTKEFNFDIVNNNITTKMTNCNNCENKCMLVTVYKNNKPACVWGNKCNNTLGVKNI